MFTRDFDIRPSNTKERQLPPHLGQIKRRSQPSQYSDAYKSEYHLSFNETVKNDTIRSLNDSRHIGTHFLLTPPCLFACLSLHLYLFPYLLFRGEQYLSFLPTCRCATGGPPVAMAVDARDI
jgi:hypothetical protein